MVFVYGEACRQSPLLVPRTGFGGRKVHDLCRHTDGHCPWRHVGEDQGIGCNADTIADPYPADNRGIGADEDVITNYRDPSVHVGPDRYAMHYTDSVADDHTRVNAYALGMDDMKARSDPNP